MKKYLILLLIPFLVLVPSFGSNAESSGDLAIDYGYDSNYYGDYNNSVIGLCSEEYSLSSIYDSNVNHHLFYNYSTYINGGSKTIQDLSNYNYNRHSTSDYPYFIALNFMWSGTNYVQVFFYSSDTYYYTNGNSGYFSSESSQDACCYEFIRNTVDGSLSFNAYYVRTLDRVPGTLDADPSYLYSLGTLSTYQLLSNYHIYDCTDTYLNSYDSVDAFKAFLNGDSDYINKFKDVNYLLYDSNGSFDYTNPINGYNGGSGSESGGESAVNNLYMNNPKWQFNNIPSFGSLLDSNSKGSAVFSGQLTDYQKQNLDKFKLQFSFNTFWSGYTVRIGSDDVTPITSNFSKSFLYETEVSLSDFYNSGGISSFYIDDIFENSISNDVDQTINDFADFYIHEYGSGTNTFRTSFNVKLVALDNSGDSGTCTAYYSYKTGTGQTTNNSMGINSNPYVDDDGNSTGVTDPFDNPSGSGNGVGNVGDGSIVNNNNPVININNNNQFEDGDSDGLLSKILLLLANNQTASSEGLSEVADTTGYVQVLGATFTAVPSNWWTVLTAAFIASIGIIVVSFVLKVILNFVT